MSEVRLLQDGDTKCFACAYDTVLVVDDFELIQETLREWKNSLTNHGSKMSHEIMEHIIVSRQEGELRINGHIIRRVNVFKCLESVIPKSCMDRIGSE